LAAAERAFEPTGPCAGNLMAETLDDTIRENAEGPAEAKGDSVAVRQHDLKDQVEADRYLASKRAMRQGRGFRVTRVVPPGA
jgi:hypothetical protein